jgi:hypothetical protein
MAVGQVVLYFEKQEDAVQFTLAASSIISADGPVRITEAAAKVAQEICKASRIRTEGTLATPQEERSSHPETQCA